MWRKATVRATVTNQRCAAQALGTANPIGLTWCHQPGKDRGTYFMLLKIQNLNKKNKNKAIYKAIGASNVVKFCFFPFSRGIDAEVREAASEVIFI